MSATEPAPVRLTAALDVLPTYNFDSGIDDRQAPSGISTYDPIADDVTTC